MSQHTLIHYAAHHSSAVCSCHFPLPDNSHCAIASKTHVSTATVARIANKVDPNKENSKGGHPAKLSDTNKLSGRR
jgi:hypothetical protein